MFDAVATPALIESCPAPSFDRKATRTRKPKMGRKHDKVCPVCKKRHDPWEVKSKGLWVLTKTIGKDANGRTIYDRVTLGRDHDEAIALWKKMDLGLVAESTPDAITDATRIDDLCNQFLAVYRPSGDASADRVADVEAHLKMLCKAHGADTIGSLRGKGIERLKAWVKKQAYTNNTTRNFIASLKMPFVWACKHGLQVNPLKELKKPPVEARCTWFSKEQIDAILDAAKNNPVWVMIFKILIFTGMRPKELVTLTAANVHEHEKGLYLMVDHKNMRKKGNKQRQVELPPPVQVMIRELVAKYPKGQLFRSPHGGRVDVRWVNQIFDKLRLKPACAALGLGGHVVRNGVKAFDYVVYSARHTFAARWIRGHYNGVMKTYAQIATLMGNSAKMVEDTYGHLRPQDASAGYDQMTL